MGDIIVIVILAVVGIVALKNVRLHFKGSCGCCGGGKDCSCCDDNCPSRQKEEG